jgi:hypothetical protein
LVARHPLRVAKLEGLVRLGHRLRRGAGAAHREAAGAVTPMRCRRLRSRAGRLLFEVSLTWTDWVPVVSAPSRLP